MMHTRRLKNLNDLRRWLAYVANQMERGEVNINYARCAAYIASIMSGIIQNSDIEDRITKLEKEIETEK